MVQIDQEFSLEIKMFDYGVCEIEIQDKISKIS